MRSRRKPFCASASSPTVARGGAPPTPPVPAAVPAPAPGRFSYRNMSTLSRCPMGDPSLAPLAAPPPLLLVAVLAPSCTVHTLPWRRPATRSPGAYGSALPPALPMTPWDEAAPSGTGRKRKLHSYRVRLRAWRQGYCVGWAPRVERSVPWRWRRRPKASAKGVAPCHRIVRQELSRRVHAKYTAVGGGGWRPHMGKAAHRTRIFSRTWCRCQRHAGVGIANISVARLQFSITEHPAHVHVASRCHGAR
jgi:hypothetical protein